MGSYISLTTPPTDYNELNRLFCTNEPRYYTTCTQKGCFPSGHEITPTEVKVYFDVIGIKGKQFKLEKSLFETNCKYCKREIHRKERVFIDTASSSSPLERKICYSCYSLWYSQFMSHILLILQCLLDNQVDIIRYILPIIHTITKNQVKFKLNQTERDFEDYVNEHYDDFHKVPQLRLPDSIVSVCDIFHSMVWAIHKKQRITLTFDIFDKSWTISDEDNSKMYIQGHRSVTYQCTKFLTLDKALKDLEHGDWFRVKYR